MPAHTQGARSKSFSNALAHNVNGQHSKVTDLKSAKGSSESRFKVEGPFSETHPQSMRAQLIYGANGKPPQSPPPSRLDVYA